MKRLDPRSRYVPSPRNDFSREETKKLVVSSRGTPLEGLGTRSNSIANDDARVIGERRANEREEIGGGKRRERENHKTARIKRQGRSNESSRGTIS